MIFNSRTFFNSSHIHNRHADDIEISEPDIADEESNTEEGSDAESNAREESDADSNTQEESDTDSVYSMSAGEWMSYTDTLDSAMMQAYEDASTELSPSTTVDNMLADSPIL